MYTLNNASLSPQQAESHLKQTLYDRISNRHLSILATGTEQQKREAQRRLDGLAHWIEQKFPDWLNHLASNPGSWGVEIKLVRAYRRGLIFPNRRYAKYPSNWPNVSRIVKSQDGDACVICHRQFPPNQLHAHHIIFRSRSGTNRKQNLATLCFDCHQTQHPHHEIGRYGGEPEGDAEVEVEEELVQPRFPQPRIQPVPEPQSETSQPNVSSATRTSVPEIKKPQTNAEPRHTPSAIKRTTVSVRASSAIPPSPNPDFLDDAFWLTLAITAIFFGVMLIAIAISLGWE